MSYILDALKRSEQERQRSSVPSLSTAPLFIEPAKQPPLRLYGVAATILMLFGLLAGWLRPWQHGNPAGTDRTASIKDHPAQSSPAPIAVPVRAEPGIRKPQGLEPGSAATAAIPAVSATIPRPDASPLSKRARKPRRPQPPVARNAAPEIAQPRPADPPAATAVENRVSAKPQPEIAASSAQSSSNQRILALEELPPSVQQEIPRLSISGYSYSSTPEERLVGINGRLLQEGDYLADGLKLEHINTDGLIFSYKNYRFRKTLD